MSLGTESAHNRQNKILPAKFDNTDRQRPCLLGYLENFKQKIGFRQLLESGISYDKHHNAKFTQQLTPSNSWTRHPGISCFVMDELRRDNAYLKLKGPAPSEKVCRICCWIYGLRTASELRLLNKQLLARKAQPRVVAPLFSTSTTPSARSMAIRRAPASATILRKRASQGKSRNSASTNEVVNLTLEMSTIPTTNWKRSSRKCRVAYAGTSMATDPCSH